MKKVFNLFGVVLVGLFCFITLVKADTTSITSFEELQAIQNIGGSARLDDDIIMTNDIRFREDLVLDLNGHTLSTNTGMTLIVLSNVTFKDSATGGKVTSGSLEGNYVQGTDWQSIQVGGSDVSGTLTIESGTYEAKYVIHGANGKLVINGGEFTGTSEYIIGNNPNGEFEVEINGGTLNYSGEYQAINAHAALITMNDGKIKSTSGFGIVAWKNANVVVNGGTIEAYNFAVSGNGSASGANEGTNAKITINGGKLKSTTATAVYAPQVDGVTTITNGVLEAAGSAVEVRAGKLIISGGTFNANVDHNGVVSNGNGVTTFGAAVAIAQHTTKQPIVVEITGGTFNGYLGLKESNPQGNSAEDIAKISINVTGGTFNATSEEAVYSEDFTDFITGGSYSTSVEDYVKEGYAEKLENGMYNIYKVRTITLNEVKNGTAVLSSTSGVYKDEVTVTTNSNDEYVLESIKVLTSDNKEVEVNDNSFIMPDDDVTVTVRFIKVIPNEVPENIEEPVVALPDQVEAQDLFVEALQQNEELLELVSGDDDAYIELVMEETELTDDEKNEIVSSFGVKDIEILGNYDISIIVKDGFGNEIGNIEELSDEIELVVYFPTALEKAKDGYARNYYVVREHDGKYELIEAKLADDGLSLSFKSNKFSTYTLAYNDTPVETTNPKTNDNIVLFAVVSVVTLVVGVIAAKKIFVSNKK